MRILMFYHSLVSDWNHGNAHFLRGITSELLARGHQVTVYEPRDGWSMRNLIAEHGHKPLHEFASAYPQLTSCDYDLNTIDLDSLFDEADLVLVHEWNDPALVKRIGALRGNAKRPKLLFHDTHHRMVTAPEAMASYDLSNYDGVLAYGKVLRELYLTTGRAKRAWTWHEAADTRVFRPIQAHGREGDLVWIGNWGDEERTAELNTYFIEPARKLRLKVRAYGVRYPQAALDWIQQAGIEYRGWLPNFKVPRVFSQFKATIHIPRSPYSEALPGIPTIRVFEALACGIPLVCSWWEDSERLFGKEDFLVARTGAEMQTHLKTVLNEPQRLAQMAQNGLETIRKRHTCAHRVDELLQITKELDQA